MICEICNDFDISAKKRGDKIICDKCLKKFDKDYPDKHGWGGIY